MLIPAACMLIFACVTMFVLRRNGRAAHSVNGAPVTE
jgi:hypothetical protein